MDADSLRTGWYPNQPLLDPDAVAGASFSQVFDAPVTGQIYAQPLVANGVVFVATETNDLFGLDALDGSVRWTHNLGEPWHPSDFNCNDLVPAIGITGTPAIDTATGTAYLLSKTYAAGTSGPAVWQAHAVDVLTGEERSGFPVTVEGVADNDPAQTFDPTHHMQRPGLLLMDDVVYAAFGAHCDVRPYAGWVVGISTDGHLTTLWSTQAGPPRTDGGGIWQAGAGLVSDGPGQILFATGNDFAPTPAPTDGHSPPRTLGEAVVRLGVGADGKLAARDFFAPHDLANWNISDSDLGSGGPVALPARFGTAAHPNLLVQAGKVGYVYLLDRDDLGGFDQGPAGGDRALQVLGPHGGVWSKPAVWPGDEGYVYLPVIAACSGPTDPGGCLRAFRYGTSADGAPTLSPAATSVDAFGYGSSNVIVTSDGMSSGSALLWGVWSSGWNGFGSQLRAYDALPVDGALRLRLLLPIGQSAKFTAPSVGDGRIYVGTRDGHVLGFGFTNAAPLRASGLAFPTVLLGESAGSLVTLQAWAPLEITTTEASDDYTVASPAPSFPSSLRAGETLSVPILFVPGADGQRRGTLKVTTNRGTFTFSLVGAGQLPGVILFPDPPLLEFSETAVGTSSTLTLTLTNEGDAPAFVEDVTPPSPRFDVEGLPAPGDSILPSESVAATVTFTPTGRGSFSDVLSLTLDTGSLTVAMEGVGLAPGQLRLAPTMIDAGSLYIGDHVNVLFRVTNVGDRPTSIVSSIPPQSGAFVPTTPISESMTVYPGESIDEVVRVSPLVSGTTSDAWEVTADDGQGARTVTMTVLGVVNPNLPPAPAPDASTVPDGSADSGSDAEVVVVQAGTTSSTADTVASAPGQAVADARRRSGGCSTVPGNAPDPGVASLLLLALMTRAGFRGRSRSVGTGASKQLRRQRHART